MADLGFGGPPQTSKQARISSGHAAPAPHCVETLENGTRIKPEFFSTREQSDAFANRETTKGSRTRNPRGSKGERRPTEALPRADLAWPRSRCYA